MKVIEELKKMDDERFLGIYQALENQGFGPLDGEVAKVMKFRPPAIRKLPMNQRARRARALLLNGSKADLTYELFGSYLMKECRSLVTDFLDATGVSHKDGMIEDVEDAKPAPEKLSGAIKELDEKYDRGDVTLYLSLCAEQWPQVPEVESLWRMR